jgi:hypothetical protein
LSLLKALTVTSPSAGLTTSESKTNFPFVLLVKPPLIGELDFQRLALATEGLVFVLRSLLETETLD